MDIIIVVGAVLVALLLGLMLFRVRRRKHRLTGPELRNRARREAEEIAALVEDQRSKRPPDDPVIKHHEFSHRRVTVHDEETRDIYVRDHLPEVSLLRQQFAERRIQNQMLDGLYEHPENEADLRTITTALEQMADKLQRAAKDRR